MFHLDPLGSLCVRDLGLCCKCSVPALRSAAQHRGVTRIQTQVFGLAAKAFRDLRRDPDGSPAIDISAPGCPGGRGAPSPQTYTRLLPGRRQQLNTPPPPPLLHVSSLARRTAAG